MKTGIPQICIYQTKLGDFAPKHFKILHNKILGMLGKVYSTLDKTEFNDKHKI